MICQWAGTAHSWDAYASSNDSYTPPKRPVMDAELWCFADAHTDYLSILYWCPSTLAVRT